MTVLSASLTKTGINIYDIVEVEQVFTANGKKVKGYDCVVQGETA